jgi:hypothetical protein
MGGPGALTTSENERERRERAGTAPRGLASVLSGAPGP